MLALPFSSFPNLKTERLLLRQLTVADAAALLTLRSNDTVNKYLDRPKTVTTEGALQFIEKITAGINNGQALYWVIALQENNQLIGTICLWNIDAENESMEIGYELLPDFHRKKIMQEAIQRVIDFAFNNLQLKNITAFTMVANIASTKLLQKNNFVIDTSGKYDLEAKEMEGNIIYILHKA